MQKHVCVWGSYAESTVKHDEKCADPHGAPALVPSNSPWEAYWKRTLRQSANREIWLFWECRRGPNLINTVSKPHFPYLAVVLFFSSLLTPFGHPFGTLFGHTLDQKTHQGPPEPPPRRLEEPCKASLGPILFRVCNKLFRVCGQDLLLGSFWSASTHFLTQKMSQKGAEMSPERIQKEVHKTVYDQNMELMFAPKFTLSFPMDIFTIFDEWATVVKIWKSRDKLCSLFTNMIHI